MRHLIVGENEHSPILDWHSTVWNERVASILRSQSVTEAFAIEVAAMTHIRIASGKYIHWLAVDELHFSALNRVVNVIVEQHCSNDCLVLLEEEQ